MLRRAERWAGDELSRLGAPRHSTPRVPRPLVRGPGTAFPARPAARSGASSEVSAGAARRAAAACGAVTARSGDSRGCGSGASRARRGGAGDRDLRPGASPSPPSSAARSAPGWRGGAERSTRASASEAWRAPLFSLGFSIRGWPGALVVGRWGWGRGR